MTRVSAEAARAARSPLVLLLAAVLFLNYIDRGALPTAAPLIQGDLHLTSVEVGKLLSAFFYTYACLQIPIGWAVERYGAQRLLVIGLALWGVSTLLVGVVAGYPSLLLLRLMLGIGESVGFPGVTKIVALVVPKQSLGTANGIIAFAYLMGPAVGVYAGGLLIEGWGWRSMFLVFGVASLIWLWPLSRVKVRQRALEPIGAAGPTFWMILKQRSLWGTGLGHFSSNFTYYFILSWMPSYLESERGFSNLEMARLLGSAYLVNAAFAIGGGWAIDRYIATGGSANVGYKLVMGGSHLGAIVCMLCMAVGSQPVVLVSIFVYQALCGLQSPGVFAVAQILAGPNATGRWVGIQNTVGNLAGIVAPLLTAYVVQWTGHFTFAFVSAAAVGIFGVIGWVWMIPRISELRWDAQPAGRSSIASTRLG